MRLFIGLPIPAELANAMTRHARTISLPTARWIPPENIHLTLVFLGEVAEQTLPSIKRELDAIKTAPIPIRLTGLNTLSRSSILVAEVDPIPGLLNLQSQVVSSMARCGFPSEDRPYHPHITLTRFHEPLRLSNTQRILPVSLQHIVTADTINLFHSLLTPTGAQYEVLAQKHSASKAVKPPNPSSSQ